MVFTCISQYGLINKTSQLGYLLVGILIISQHKGVKKETKQVKFTLYSFNLALKNKLYISPELLCPLTIYTELPNFSYRKL